MPAYNKYRWHFFFQDSKVILGCFLFLAHGALQNHTQPCNALDGILLFEV